ncbi:hypothetical protein GCM10011583_71700 [Streptomyces camponoticapitis]|uniref:Uncharacterized protein n=1 Tax=Streptomyces camponoticapitis TaxID=1616125 RepID=A0ABQ2EW60_9ACTN|nr:hypothetical protein GCM10011583_71700 [Streptomyces camponoticapitis]
MKVFEANRPDRTDRRLRGKSGPPDAQNAARAVLSGRARARAKSGDGPVQIARMYKLTKGAAARARTQAVNQLEVVLVTAQAACAKTGRAEQPGPPPYLRTVRRRQQQQRVRGGDGPGHPHHPAPAGPPDRAAEEISKLPFDVVPAASRRQLAASSTVRSRCQPCMSRDGSSGPIGLIGHTKGDVNETVVCLWEDHMAGRLAAPDQPDPDAVVDFLA